MDLILIRHGLPIRLETQDGSPADPPLSEEGRNQALAVGRWFEHEHIDHVYVSPMRRAIETAEPLLRVRGLEATVETRVAEFDRDADYYIPLEELKRTDYPAWQRFVQGGYGDGADFESFHREAVAALLDISERHRGQRVAVVCHGGVINVWSAFVLGLEPSMFFEPGYTSVNRFRVASSGERSVSSLNELGHLSAAIQSVSST
jgi:probable phosphoglycerate mutase